MISQVSFCQLSCTTFFTSMPLLTEFIFFLTAYLFHPLSTMTIYTSHHGKQSRENLGLGPFPRNEKAEMSISSSVAVGTWEWGYGFVDYVDLAKVWRPRIPLKVKILMWRISHRRLPTRDWLHRFIHDIQAACALCGEEDEIIDHLFVGSSNSYGVWREIEAMAGDIQPLLSEVRGSALLKDVQRLTKTLAETTEDLREARSSVITPENALLLRQSILTLIDTLKNIEGITSDILVFTGDEATRQNLKSLIKSLSRLM
ncbi:hypothetical protein Taro_015970 [Colocasia esculenta]|uniref:Reverse transcriptase zinc-binding domain-containing protein n=1 Tax=Colocasia esculenta TaxID=4460 RepID=A0A843UCQ3_COLES|nr:hypothetical protein [Colocasia esculenta]